MDPKKLEALLDSKFPMEESTKYFKGLIYGQPGVTKTVTAATIGDKQLFISADPEGFLSLFNHPQTNPLNNPGRTERMNYQGVSQLEALADALMEGIPAFSHFDTLIIDTGSNIADRDLDVVVKQKIINPKVDKAGRKKEFDFEDDMWGAYRQNAYRIRQAFIKLFSCPINIVVTAHSRTIELDGSSGQKIQKTAPDFSPKILGSINGMTSMIAYMTATDAGVDSDGTVQYKRKIQYHPTATVVAKTRIGGLPPKQEGLSFNFLRDIVERWQDTGGKLLTHEEAEKEAPIEQSVEPDMRSEFNLDLEI